MKKLSYNIIHINEFIVQIIYKLDERVIHMNYFDSRFNKTPEIQAEKEMSNLTHWLKKEANQVIEEE
jgi:hypothetical protein